MTIINECWLTPVLFCVSMFLPDIILGTASQTLFTPCDIENLNSKIMHTKLFSVTQLQVLNGQGDTRISSHGGRLCMCIYCFITDPYPVYLIEAKAQCRNSLKVKAKGVGGWRSASKRVPHVITHIHTL